MPLRITLVDDCDLASAGLTTLLAPYEDRVAVVDTRTALADPEALDVVLYEPVDQSSMARSLLRDLQDAGAARAAVFSWAGAAQLPCASASPYLPKTLTAAQLVVALEQLVEGRLEPQADVEVAGVSGTPAEDPGGQTDELDDAGLTPREAEIVGLIVAGLSNREIGEELGVSVNSVKTYIRSAYRKMGVERRTQAVLWGLSRGLDQGRSPALVG